MIAQSIMTKVNKSEYVTIACPPSARSRNGWQEPSTSSLIKYIILSWYQWIRSMICPVLDGSPAGWSQPQIWVGRGATGGIFPAFNEGSILSTPWTEWKLTRAVGSILTGQDWTARYAWSELSNIVFWNFRFILFFDFLWILHILIFFAILLVYSDHHKTA